MVQSFGIQNSALNSLADTTRSTLRNFSQLASGRRIASAADDAAGLSISERLRALEKSASQGRRNYNDGLSAARVAEGGLDQSSEILQRMRELSVQANNGTLNEADRATIQQEYDRLGEELDRISQSTEFNGRQLLDGSSDASDPLTLEDGTQARDPSLALDSVGSADLGVSGLDVSDPATLDALDQAIDGVSSQRAEIGAFSNQVESGIRNLEMVEQTSAEAASRVVDLDFATALSERTKNSIISQAQLGLLAQSKVLQSSTLELLG